jgi:hypothetical protein
MVGSGAAGGGGGDHARSKEAAGMMALHEALRNVCLNSDWTYSVFWTIRPRPYVPSSPPSLAPCFHMPLLNLSSAAVNMNEKRHAASNPIRRAASSRAAAG